VTGDFCDVSSAYRPAKGEVYSARNKRWVVSHNEYGEAKCGWAP